MRHSEVRNDWLTGTTLSRLSCVITGRVAYTLSLIRPDDCHSFRSRLFGGKLLIGLLHFQSCRDELF